MTAKTLLVSASKYHSYGNDFIIVPAEQVPEENFPEFARAICERNSGLGADGCLFVSHESNQLFTLRQFNRDGSEFGMSGNGVRCAAAFLQHKGWNRSAVSRFETKSGVRLYELLQARTTQWTFRSHMGVPDFSPARVPCLAQDLSEPVQDFPLQAGGQTVLINAVWVGNPQCVIFVSELPGEEEFLRLGAALETHPFFPERTNVSFVRRDGSDRIRIRIWERGVGPTFSSGTGSCGAAVCAIRKRVAQPPVQVATETGNQTVEWQPGEEIVLIGLSEWVADVVFNWRGK